MNKLDKISKESNLYDVPVKTPRPNVPDRLLTWISVLFVYLVGGGWIVLGSFASAFLWTVLVLAMLLYVLLAVVFAFSISLRTRPIPRFRQDSVKQEYDVEWKSESDTTIL